MKIGFTIKSLEGEGGGAERVLASCANALVAAGHDVAIMTFDRPDFDTFYQLDERVERIGLGRNANLSSLRPRDMWPVMKAIRHHFGSGTDVVVSFMHSTYVPAALALVGTGVPLILSEHAAAAHFVDRPAQQAMLRMAQRLAFAKTVVSDTILAEHPPRWRKNVVVVPNPVDIAGFAAAHDQTPEKLIVCVGLLREEKGQAHLVQAFDMIAGKHPDWRLRFVGDGALRPQIELLINKASHGDRIAMAGMVQDVAGEYARAAFAVVPSRYESLSLVAVEAMASQRPVIGFADCVGPAKLIEDGVNGMLVDPGEDRIASLAAAMDQMITNDAARRAMGTAAPATVQGYAADAVFAKWERLLQAAANNTALKDIG